MATKKAAAKKSTRKAPAKQAAKKTPAKKPMVKARADFGQPVEAFFAKQSAAIAPITNALRALVKKAAPDASGSLKWGMPFYEIAGRPVCAIGAHKAHVNLILSGPATLFDDPDGLLEGAGKTGRHLKLTALADLPTAQATRWLSRAAENARQSR